MAREKWKSSQYLDFVHSKRCAICGKKPGEAHHENIHPRFRGGSKKYNDYGAVKLCTPHHSERHLIGENAFWEKHNVEVVPLVIKLNEEYIAEADPRRFSDLEEYEREIQMVQDHVDALY